MDQNGARQLVWRVHETSSANTGSLSGGGNHFLYAHSVLNEPLRIELELDLADLASNGFDPCNAGNGQETRFNRPVRNRSQCHERLLVRSETDLHDPSRGGRERSHQRRLHSSRQLAGDGGQTLSHGLTIPIDIGAGTEDNRDYRKTLNRP